MPSNQTRSWRQSRSALPLYSNVDLLGPGKSVVDLDLPR